MSAGKRLDLRWWAKEEGTDVASDVFSIVKRIRDNTASRREMDFYHACLYDDADVFGGRADLEFSPSTLAFNVVRRTVDTLTAKIAKNRPLPMPITSGGTRAQQKRAKLLGKFFEGQMDASNVWRTSPTIARDAALFGTGVTHNYRIGKKIISERVLPWELIVDAREGMYGDPRSIYLRRWIDKLVLIERFPDLEEFIEQAEDKSDDSFDVGYDSTSDLVLVVEAWHLPSSEGASDGSHVICVSNKDLVREPYKRDYFPFTVLKYSEPLVGYFGTGLGKQLTGIQYCINENAEVLQEAMRLTGGYVAVENSSDVQVEHLTNGRGQVLRYNRTAPTWINPQPAHPDQWRFVLDLIPQAFQQTGVSELSSGSQLPSGMRDVTGVALQSFADLESERFSLFAKAYQQYHIDIAWQFFDLFEEIGKFKVKVSGRERGRKVLSTLDYKAVRLDRDEFTLAVFPTSMLAKEPAARMAQVEALAKAGWIGPEDARRLLDFPDLERANDLAGASYEVVSGILERFLDAEDPSSPDAYVSPEPYFNLDLCIALGTMEYLRGKEEEVPEANLQLVQDFIQAARSLRDTPPDSALPEQAPPPGMAPPGMGPPMPMDAPMPPPGMAPPPMMPPGPPMPMPMPPPGPPAPMPV